MSRTVHATFTIERDYAFPIPRVFAAWADPDQLKQWMCGDVPTHIITQHVQEIRTGGRWKTEIHDPAKNEVYWGRGVYREVKPVEKIVFTMDTPIGAVRNALRLGG